MEDKFEFAILNIDKPSGPTSFNISDYVRKTLGLRKTSHFGTLDPKVTGVLPIALNRACKLTGFFIGHDKEYVGIMRMHEEIDWNTTGVPRKTSGEVLTRGKIEAMIKKKFLGVIKQTPPVKSRVKRQEREREVKVFELLEMDGTDILFRVVCQGGTYIRKLCDDLGRELGIGAHMLELRRTRAGIFSEEDNEFMNLYDLSKDFNGKIIPAEEALKKIFPVVQVKKESVERLLTGKPIMPSDVKGWTPQGCTPKIKDFTRGKDKFIVFNEDRFIGVYENEKPLFVYQEIRN